MFWLSVYALGTTLLLGALGVVWSPFSMIICAIAAYKKNLDVSGIAWSGFGASLLFWLPGIYFLGRLLGIPIPRKVVVATYVFVFAAWLLGPIPGGISYAREELTFVDEATLEWVKSLGYWNLQVFLLVSIPTVSSALWIASLWTVLRAGARNSRPSGPSRESPMPSPQYLMPFILLAVSFMFAFVAWFIGFGLGGQGVR